LEIRLGFEDELRDANGFCCAILVGPVERLHVFGSDFAVTTTLAGTHSKFFVVDDLLPADPARGCPSASLFFGLNAVARPAQRLTLCQFPFQGFWATVTRPPRPVTALADFFPQVVVGFDRVGAAAVGAYIIFFPVEPDLPALALQSLWIRIRAIRRVPAELARVRGLFAAGVPRYKLIFGLDM
tara:strand:- start:10 stop:561 length:552 start_codon:yes stop_codon:yes gene_type:complete